MGKEDQQVTEGTRGHMKDFYTPDDSGTMDIRESESDKLGRVIRIYSTRRDTLPLCQLTFNNGAAEIEQPIINVRMSIEATTRLIEALALAAKIGAMDAPETYRYEDFRDFSAD